MESIDQPEANEVQSYLERLQRDSWQLELIVSGLALVGLFSINGWLDEFGSLLASIEGSFIGGVVLTGFTTAYLAYLIILVSLVVHLVLRALWIGAIGLRSVSGEINWSEFKYQPQFDGFLGRKINNSHRYILLLDRICSIIFAVAFLAAMLLMGFLLYGLFISIVFYVLFWVTGQQESPKIVRWGVLVLAFIYLGAGLLYMIDFLTAGRLKKIKWLTPIYYPIYRFLGKITFARLYRPIYYNLIGIKLGRRVLIFIIPIIFLVLIFASIEINPNNYFNSALWENNQEISADLLIEKYYEDQREKDSRRNVAIIIPSDVQSENTLRVRLPYLSSYDAVIKYNCPDLPVVRNALFHSTFNPFGWTKISSKELTSKQLDCIKTAVKLSIDGQSISLENILFHRPDGVIFPEMIKYVSLDSFPAGLHRLRVQAFTYDEKGDSLRREPPIKVPFYFSPKK